MNKKQISNRFITGFLAGLILPLLIFIIVFLVSSKGMGIANYMDRILIGNSLTHTISLCVFPNIIIFLLFNRFDKLSSSKGVLGITILWALTVFLVKLI